jgi:hypothetical protein
MVIRSPAGGVKGFVVVVDFGVQSVAALRDARLKGEVYGYMEPRVFSEEGLLLVAALGVIKFYAELGVKIYFCLESESVSGQRFAQLQRRVLKILGAWGLADYFVMPGVPAEAVAAAMAAAAAAARGCSRGIFAATEDTADGLLNGNGNSHRLVENSIAPYRGAVADSVCKARLVKISLSIGGQAFDADMIMFMHMLLLLAQTQGDKGDLSALSAVVRRAYTHRRELLDRGAYVELAELQNKMDAVTKVFAEAAVFLRKSLLSVADWLLDLLNVEMKRRDRQASPLTDFVAGSTGADAVVVVIGAIAGLTRAGLEAVRFFPCGCRKRRDAPCVESTSQKARHSIGRRRLRDDELAPRRGLDTRAVDGGVFDRRRLAKAKGDDRGDARRARALRRARGHGHRVPSPRRGGQRPRFFPGIEQHHFELFCSPGSARAPSRHGEQSVRRLRRQPRRRHRPGKAAGDLVELPVHLSKGRFLTLGPSLRRGMDGRAPAEPRRWVQPGRSTVRSGPLRICAAARRVSADP